jgi:hypothetical protein
VNRKFDALKLYRSAEKLGGYALRITGDIDTSVIDFDKEMLSCWIALAKEVGSTSPIVYVTDLQEFEISKQLITKLDSDVTVGIHGIKHIHYSKAPFGEYCDDARRECQLSNIHRFPYLDWNIQMLQFASYCFTSDSSIVSGWMYPFKIGDMIEYPVCPPTDTALRNKPVTPLVVQLYRQIIKQAEKDDKPLTLLLHPNSWTVELLKHLSVCI